MEGRLSAVCILILTLGAIGHLDAESIIPIGAHTGVCPHPAFCNKLDFCAKATFVICSHDSECNKNEKCCHNGCARVCTKASTVRPGVCPLFPVIKGRICMVNVKAVCVDDTDCLNNEKCCMDQCGPVCAKPRKVKPGLCPNWKLFEDLKRPQRWRKCINDWNCPKYQKCCMKGCESFCVTAVKPGHCPKLALDKALQCQKRRQRSCIHDFQCPKTWKCCKNQCGRVCTPLTNWNG